MKGFEGLAKCFKSIFVKENNIKMSPWVKSTLSGLVGTTVGIILTFGTTAYIERCQKAETEYIAEMMVIKNIDDYKKKLEGELDSMESTDSLYTLLYTLNPDSLEYVETEILDKFAASLSQRMLALNDYTAINIFSSGIDTWKTIGRADFISNVGRCFDLMKRSGDIYVELQTKKFAIYENIVTENFYKLKSNRDLVRICLRSPEVRFFMECYHSYYYPMVKMTINVLDEQNKRNMEMVNITREDLDKFSSQHEIRQYESNRIE